MHGTLSFKILANCNIKNFDLQPKAFAVVIVQEKQYCTFAMKRILMNKREQNYYTKYYFCPIFTA